MGLEFGVRVRTVVKVDELEVWGSGGYMLGVRVQSPRVRG